MKTLGMIIILILAVSQSYASIETRFVGKKNKYGYLACEQQTKDGSGKWVTSSDVTSEKCISERRFITGEKKLIFENCFEQGRAITEDGTPKWFYVDFALRDSNNCVGSKTQFIANEQNGRFACFQRALVLEDNRKSGIVPTWKYVDFATRDQKLCDNGVNRFVPYVVNGMLQACHPQAAVTLESGEVKWLAYDFSGRDQANCVLAEKCVRGKDSSQFFKQVAITDEHQGVSWIYLNYLAYSNNQCR